MKKYYFLALILITAHGLSAQNAALKIPANANVVGSINLGKINSMMPMAEWDKTTLGKKLKEMRGNDTTLQYNTLQELGVDLASTLYYFHTENDSMHLNTMLVSLTNALNTDKFFANKEIVRLAGNVRKHVDNDSTGYFMWNDVQMIYVKAIIKEAYFKDAVIAQRHGLSYYETSNYNNYDEEAAVAVDEFFYTTPITSVLSNKRFVKNYDANAAASIWVDNPMDFYSNLLPSYLLQKTNPLNVAYKVNDGAGYESFAASLLLDDKKISVHTQMEMSPDMAAMQEKIMDRKLNKRFFKYIDIDSMLGYMSWALDTKAYLQQMPKMLEHTYQSMGMGVGGEEASLAAEFISFLIDEEAIANMIKGDAMVVFDGVYQQQVNYTDYTYDEDYKATEVQKTRTETLPRFLMMMSSEENNLIKKLVNYGIKKSVVKENGAFYEMEIPKSPVKLFFMHKDDIFFLTNSINNMEQISAGTFKGNLSKKEKKNLSSHPFSMYINPKNISGKIAQTEFGATESLADMMNSFNKMGEVRMQANPLKNNIYGADIWMDVPAGNTNAVTYFFSLFDGMLK